MRSIRRSILATILLGLIGLQGLGAQTADAGAEAATRSALEAFIGAWNTADDAELRKTMNFPFVSLFGGGAIVAQEPQDFSTDFAAMRQRNDWARSAFDFETLQILASSDDKVHCAIDFHRYNSEGERYMQGTAPAPSRRGCAGIPRCGPRRGTASRGRPRAGSTAPGSPVSPGRGTASRPSPAASRSSVATSTPVASGRWPAPRGSLRYNGGPAVPAGFRPCRGTLPPGPSRCAHGAADACSSKATGRPRRAPARA